MRSSELYTTASRGSRRWICLSCWPVSAWKTVSGELDSDNALCLKLKVDKAKILATSGVKKAIFDRLCNQMEKISQQLSKDDVPLAAETSESLQTDPEHCEKEDGSEDDDDEEEVVPCKQPKTETKQDYEEWKKRILENAAKAQQADRGTDSVPPCNITAACS